MSGRDEIERMFSAYDIPVDAGLMAKSSGRTTIADATCVVHPKGVKSYSLTRSLRDDVHVNDLGNFNIVGKPVTFGHGEWGGDKWVRMPAVVGHVVGKRMDEAGRLLAHFVLHDTPAGRIAHAHIINRQLTDVSPMFFSKLRADASTQRGDETGESQIDYHCNHLALCDEGRRPGTYILALRSKIGSGADGAVKHMRLKNPDVINATESSRHATDVLFQDPSGADVRKFFVTFNSADTFIEFFDFESSVAEAPATPGCSESSSAGSTSSTVLPRPPTPSASTSCSVSSSHGFAATTNSASTKDTMSDAGVQNNNGSATSATPAADAQATKQPVENTQTSSAMDTTDIGAQQQASATEAAGGKAGSAGMDTEEAAPVPMELDDETRKALTQIGLPSDAIMSFAKTFDELESKSNDASAQQALRTMADAFKTVRDIALSKGTEANTLREQLNKIETFNQAREADTFTTVVNSARECLTENELAKQNAALCKVQPKDFDQLMSMYNALPDADQRRSLARVLTWTTLNSRSTEAQLCSSRAQLENHTAATQKTEAEKARVASKRKYLDALLNIRTGSGGASTSSAGSYGASSCGMSDSDDLLGALTPRSNFSIAINSADPSTRFAGMSSSATGGAVVGAKRSHGASVATDVQSGNSESAKKATPSFLDSFVDMVRDM